MGADIKKAEDQVDKDNGQTSDVSATQQFLTFCVGDEEYGVQLMTIREIRGWTVPTQLPNSPSFMKGVINLRGVVIPIFDLRHRFNMGVTTPNEKNVVIIIAVGERLIGILVDAVSDILEVTKEQIRPAPQVDSKIDEDFVEGLISVEDKMVVILNIENLFDPETLAHAEKLASKSKTKIEKESGKKEKETSVKDQEKKPEEAEIEDK